MKMVPMEPVCGMWPFFCSFWHEGKHLGVTLYATDPRQIEEDFPHVTVDGPAIGYVDQ